MSASTPTDLRSLRFLRSMTGYATGLVVYDGLALSVSLRSVNHRHLDLRVHMPDALMPLEFKSRELIRARGARGHLDLSVEIQFAAAGSAPVDEAALNRYLETFQRIGNRLGISATADMVSLAQLPGVIPRKEAAAIPGITPELEAAYLKGLGEVVERWDTMRAQEAARLVEDLTARLANLNSNTAQLERWQQEKLGEAQKRMVERLQALAGQTPGLDPARLAQEALLIADRTDASEEILRLKAHIAQFAESLDEADAGRKLDFLLQEMQRETGTLMAKVAGLGEVSLPMTRLGLDMKAEIEKLREQVQNLQ